MARKSTDKHSGLALPEAAREKLRKAGIFVQTVVTVEHQHLAHRYVVRGVESGGAVEGFGHYVTFAAEDGGALAWLCQVESLAVNGPHAVVVWPVLVRAEMLRVGCTYELLITRHRPGTGTQGRKPALASELLFHGQHGHLAEGEPGLPAFWTRGGDPQAVPEHFMRVVLSLVTATKCAPCEHSHYVADPKTVRSKSGSGPEMQNGAPDANRILAVEGTC